MTREVGLARLWSIVQRRKLAVGVTVMAVAALGLLLVKAADPTYKARAVVKINDPQPAREYAMPLASEPVPGEGMRSERLGFLAQPVLLTAAEKVGILPANASESTRRRIVGEMSAHLDARLEGDSSFVLTYQDADPERARALLAAIIEAHAAWYAQTMSTRAADTAKFFEAQVASLRPRVADAEAEVEKFRLSRYGALPDQLESNLRIFDESVGQIHTLTASLDAAMARRRDILMDTQSPIRHQEESVATALSQARTRFAADAPEVVALEKELKRVRADREADEGELTRRVKGGSELRGVDAQIASTQQQIALLAKRRDELQGRIDEVAKNGEALARLSVDRDVLRERLRSLVVKHEEASLAAGLETEIAGRARVTVIEPAWAGTMPIKPNKPLLAAVVLCLALALGLGVGLLLDMIDRRVRTPGDIRVLTGDIPVLGVVPYLGRPGRNVKTSGGAA
jgi:polysaccharide biosynthesis transport protein